MSEQEFIEQFEACTLDKELFDHKHHLWLAWIYTKNFTLRQACTKLCNNIYAYASSLGAKDKFHKTITIALACLVRIKFKEQQSFEQFIIENSDLVNNAQQELNRYYSNDLIQSESAKHSFVFPDKTQFPKEYQALLEVFVFE